MASSNKRLKIVLLSAVTIAIIYSAAWYGFALYIKGKFLEAANYKDITTLSYDDIGIAGYPLRAGVTVKNPDFTFELGKLLTAAMVRKKDKEVSEELKNSTLVYHFTSKNTLTITTDFLAKDFSIESTKGHLQDTISSNDQVVSTFTEGGDTSMQVGLRHSPFFSKPEPSPNLAESFPLRYINFYADNVRATNPENDEVLLQHDGTFIEASFNPTNEDSGEAELKVKQVNFYFGEESNAYYNTILNMPYVKALQKALNTQFPPVDYSIYGKTNNDIHVTYAGTTNSEVFKKKKGQFTIGLHKYNVSNALYDNKASGVLELALAEDGPQKLNLKFNSDGTFSENYHDYAKRIIATYAPQTETKLLSKNTDITNLTEKELVMLQAEQATKKIFDNIATLLPDFHALGNMRENIHIEYDKSVADALHVKQLDIVNDLYGIELKGTFAKQNGAPNVNTTLQLTNYPQLIDIATAYYQKAAPIFVDTPPTLKEGFTDAIKASLRKIANQPQANSNDVEVTVKMDGKSPPTIGTLNIMQAMPYIQVPFMLFVERQQGSTAAPTAAPVQPQ
jgi:hypothetical protein